MNSIKKVIFYFFCFYLFITPLLPLRVTLLNRNFPPGDVMLFIVFLIYLVYILVFKDNRRSLFLNLKSFIADKFNISAVVVLIVMAVSVIYAGNRAVAVKESFRFGTYIVLLYILQTEYSSGEWLGKIVVVCLYGAVTVSVLGIFQYFTGFMLAPEFIYEASETKRITSTLDNPNTLAAYLMFFLFPSTATVFNSRKLKGRVLHTVVTVLLLTNILMTGSRSSIVGIVVGTAVFVLLVSRKYIVLFFSVGVISLFFKPVNSRIFSMFDSSLNDSRIKLWALGMKMVEKNPVFGVGNGNYVTNYNAYTARYPELKYGHFEDFPSHNSYIKVWSELGILGILSFITLVILSIVKVYGFIKDCSDERIKVFYLGFLCSLCGFYVMNFFDNLLFIPKIALYFWVFLSINKSSCG